MIVELAYWDERHDGVRVPVVLEPLSARTCVITRSAAEELSSAAKLTARECFGVTRRHMREVQAILRSKIAGGAMDARTALLIDKDDVVAARTPSSQGERGHGLRANTSL
jgi:hypothetical protein